MVYFDKYRYEKIDFEKVAFFLLLIVYRYFSFMITFINLALSNLDLNYRNEYIFVKGICFQLKCEQVFLKTNKN